MVQRFTAGRQSPTTHSASRAPATGYHLTLTARWGPPVKRLSVLLFCSCSLLLSGPSSTTPTAKTLQSIETYKGPKPQSCNSLPQPSTSFSPEDLTVNVLFVVNGMSPTGGDTVQLHWINPSSSWALTSFGIRRPMMVLLLGVLTAT